MNFVQECECNSYTVADYTILLRQLVYIYGVEHIEQGGLVHHPWCQHAVHPTEGICLWPESPKQYAMGALLPLQHKLGIIYNGH